MRFGACFDRRGQFSPPGWSFLRFGRHHGVVQILQGLKLKNLKNENGVNQMMVTMLRIFILDSLFSSSVKQGSCVGGPSAFNSPFGHRSRSHNIRPLDNHLWSIDISLKLGAQLSI